MVTVTNSKNKKSPLLQCSPTALRIGIALFLLAISFIPFFAMKQVQKVEHHHGFHPDKSKSSSANNNQVRVRNTQSNNNGNAAPQRQNDVQHNAGQQQKYEPVICEKYQNDATIFDSNAELTKDETKRLTITDPPFYISLHSMWFDKKRWVHIMKQGEYYETGMTKLFHDILSKYDLSEGGERPLVLDIGMNIGWFSLWSHALGHDVAAFEPNPTMFLRVCESLEYNNWNQNIDHGVTLWNYGLGVTPGTFNLTLGNNPGGSSFHSERLAPKYRHEMPVSVAVLDTIAQQEGWLDRKISLVKVDVEGFENFVFEGGKKLIYNGNVENIVMENSITDVEIVGGMMDMLYDAGYRIAAILSVNGDPYHEDWWPTFNPALKERHNVKDPAVSDQLAFLARATSNIWWQHKRLRPAESS